MPYGILSCALPVLLHMMQRSWKMPIMLKFGIHWWNWWPT